MNLNPLEKVTLAYNSIHYISILAIVIALIIVLVGLYTWFKSGSSWKSNMALITGAIIGGGGWFFYTRTGSNTRLAKNLGMQGGKYEELDEEPFMEQVPEHMRSKGKSAKGKKHRVVFGKNEKTEIHELVELLEAEQEPTEEQTVLNKVLEDLENGEEIASIVDKLIAAKSELQPLYKKLNETNKARIDEIIQIYPGLVVIQTEA
jgi:hypothetical protein